MEKTNFDQLLSRYLTGQVSERERIKIEAWLKVIQKENDANSYLSRDAEEKIFQNIVDKHSDLASVSGRSIREKKNSKMWLLKLAASLILLTVASYGIWNITKHSDRIEIASQNIVDKIQLNDGTLVWLKKNSTLTYYQKDQDGKPYRFSQLEGEGLFEIAKDATRPFIIECGEVKIRVLGTSFNLRTVNDTVELSVLTGKVNLSSSARGTTIDATHHEKVIYAAGQFQKMSLKQDNVEKLTEHTEYRMMFANAPMSTVLERIEKKFDVDITVEHPEVYQCQVTMDLTDHSLEKSLEMIRDILHVGFDIEQDNVTLTGSGCD